MKQKGFWIYILILTGIILLQSTLLKNISLFGGRPDISLIFLVFSAHTIGSFKGEILGFWGGISQDLITLAPLGFNGALRTTIGLLSGMTKGKFFIESIVLQILLIIVATFIKGILSFFILLVFIPESAVSAFSPVFFLELGYNALLAPFMYKILKLIKLVKSTTSEGF